MTRNRLAIWLGAVVVGVIIGMVASPALATQPTETGHKVTICHRTHSDTNPYVQITVDIASAGYGLGKGDHFAEHKGPVWELGLKEQHIEWGDIIPPYEYQPEDGDLFVFPGYNWTDAGIDFYENDCKRDDETPPPTSPPPTSPPPTSPPPTSTSTPPPTSTTPPTHSTTTVPPTSPPPIKTAETGLGNNGIKAAGAGLLLLGVGFGLRLLSRRQING